MFLSMKFLNIKKKTVLMPVKSEVTRDKSACVTADLTSCLPHFKASGSHPSVDDKFFCDMTS